MDASQNDRLVLHDRCIYPSVLAQVKRVLVMNDPITLSIIIPAYNEGRNIAECIKNIAKIMADLKLDYEVIVVDDGSNDYTYNIASALARKNMRVKVVKNILNMGKGHAIKTGFQRSKGKIVSCLDVDMLISLKQVTDGLHKLREASVVIASKRHPRSKINYSRYRSFLSRCFNLLVKIMFRLPFSDTQCGFKLFRREVLEEVIYMLLVKRYAFDVELLVNAHRKGYRIVEIPIIMRNREKQVYLKNILRMAVDLLIIFFRSYFLSARV